ncbi:MAG TPA: STAS domain-containing protein [Actinoplanes sp.]|jgi:anti-anti-sigma factor|nr:STAS domain-containing protein [Actinoplanes sp.]
MKPGHLTFVPEQLRINTTTTSVGTICVQVGGEVDLATVTPLAEVLAAAVVKRPATIEVDLADVPFMDSTGVNALVRAYHSAASEGCRLRVVQPQHSVHRVLYTCGLLEMFGL